MPIFFQQSFATDPTVSWRNTKKTTGCRSKLGHQWTVFDLLVMMSIEPSIFGVQSFWTETTLEVFGSKQTSPPHWRWPLRPIAVPQRKETLAIPTCWWSVIPMFWICLFWHNDCNLNYQIQTNLQTQQVVFLPWSIQPKHARTPTHWYLMTWIHKVGDLTGTVPETRWTQALLCSRPSFGCKHQSRSAHLVDGWDTHSHISNILSMWASTIYITLLYWRTNSMRRYWLWFDFFHRNTVISRVVFSCFWQQRISSCQLKVEVAKSPM